MSEKQTRFLDYFGNDDINTFMLVASQNEYFTFKFPNKTVQVPKYHADFISPIIRHIHRSDPLFDTFEFDFDDEEDSLQAIFDCVFNPSKPKKIQNLKSLVQICQRLQCTELIDDFLPPISEENLSSLIARLEFKLSHKIPYIKEELTVNLPRISTTDSERLAKLQKAISSMNLEMY